MNEFFFIILAVILLIFSLKNNKYLFFLSCLWLFVISAYRGLEVGTDTINYYSHYLIIQSGCNLNLEPFWVILLKIISFFNGDYQDVLIVSSCLVLFPIFFVIYKKSKNPQLSLFLYYTLYFYFYSFNITRQSIASSLVFVAIYFLSESDIKKFVFLVLMAGGFHYSAFIAFVLLLSKYTPSRIYIYILTAAFFSGLFFPDLILKYILEIFSYESYRTQYFGNFIGNALFLLILNSFFVFIMTIVQKKDILLNIFFVSILFSNLLCRIPYGNRVVMFFSIIQIVYLVDVIYNNNKIIEQKIVYLIVILYAFTLFFRLLGAGGIFPYTNVIL